MTLEEANQLDIVTTARDGGLNLLIIDVGSTPEPQARYQKLLQKLKGYVGYIMSDEFKSQHPDMKSGDVTIYVVCNIPPTKQMQEIQNVRPRGDEASSIPVKFTSFDKLP